MEDSELNKAAQPANAAALQDDNQLSGTDAVVARTPGLKLFDVFLYPILTNIIVFGVSVGATYLTNRGAEKNAVGELLHGKLGKFFNERGEWLREKFTAMGMSNNQADMSKMVAFSFIDGSLMAPVVKAFEDRREHIGRAIDTHLGTVPKNDDAYDAEPKQSWLSVLAGRLGVVSLIVPTAYALDKTGLNDTLFNKPGYKFGEYLASKPAIAKLAGKFHLPELARVGAFEAFYTSVCTAGLYFSSRFIADKIRHDKTPYTNPAAAPLETQSAPADDGGVKSFSASIRPKEKILTAPIAAFTQRLDAEPDMNHTRA